jgi:hypothetical protein
LEFGDMRRGAERLALSGELALECDLAAEGSGAHPRVWAPLRLLYGS